MIWAGRGLGPEEIPQPSVLSGSSREIVCCRVEGCYFQSGEAPTWIPGFLAGFFDIGMYSLEVTQVMAYIIYGTSRVFTLPLFLSHSIAFSSVARLLTACAPKLQYSKSFCSLSSWLQRLRQQGSKASILREIHYPTCSLHKYPTFWTKTHRLLSIAGYPQHTTPSPFISQSQTTCRTHCKCRRRTGEGGRLPEGRLERTVIGHSCLGTQLSSLQ